MFSCQGRSVLMIVLAVLLVSSVQICAQDVHRKSSKNELQTCAKGIWMIDSIDEDPGEFLGNTLLKFHLPPAKQISVRYEALLACEGIVINGTGSQKLRVKKDQKKTVQFHLHLPVPRDEEEVNLYTNDLNHTCTYELRDVSKYSGPHKKTSIITQCSLRVRTYQQRILPTCNYEQSKNLIEEVEISKEQGQVNIYLKHSANDVVTVDHDCYKHNILKHNKTKTMEAEVFPLRPLGSPNIAMLVTFYPPCDSLNDTVRAYFMKQPMDDCHLEIFALCQEGALSISETKIDFDDDALLCHSPKPSYVEALESLELRFRIESMPIAALLLFLIVNGVLYILIIPFTIPKCMRCIIKKLRKVEKKIAKIKRKGSPSARAPALVENDELQISLFDKLSSDDLRQQIAESPRLNTIITQVEVHTEPVDEQPRKEEVLIESELISRSHRKNSAKKRKHSTGDKAHKKRKHSTSTRKEQKLQEESSPKPASVDTALPPIHTHPYTAPAGPLNIVTEEPNDRHTHPTTPPATPLPKQADRDSH